MTVPGEEPLHFEDDPAALVARRRPRVGDFDRHEWSVLLPLALVGFFSNYDTGLLSLGAPAIADGLDVSVATFGVGVAVIRLAALGSVGTLRLADRWGRRSVLIVSVIAFTAATGATALAWSLIAFVCLQMVARLFLATEETLSAVVLTEELRPDRRGAGIGLLGILGSAGFGLVALLLLAQDATSLGWRLFYVVALFPLAAVVYLRARLGETRAFGVAARQKRVQRSFWPKVDARDRPNLWRVTILLGVVGLLTTTAFFYAAELAQDDYGWEGLFTVIVIAAGPATFAGYFAGGRLSDRFGRRPLMAMSVVAFAAGGIILFSESRALYAPGFFLLAGADAAVQSVRAAYLGELFPTEVRATLASFTGAVIVAAGSAGLVGVGLLADRVDPSVSLIVLSVVVMAVTVLLRGLPETAGTDVIGAR